MKFKTTQKEIRRNYSKILKVGYCDMQNLLHYQSPIAYNEGVYGWNCDIYTVNNIAIVTGYRPFGVKYNTYILMREYEQKANEIIYSRDKYSVEQKEELVNNLLNDYLKKEFNL